MAKRDLSNPLSIITFRCPDCAHTFRREPGRIEAAPELPHHPYRYFAACEICGDEVGQQQQERALFKAWANATGPITPEGKAASAANLDGHPTPEEALRTRFNAMKHGLNARTATYFPAKPDGYPFCKACQIDRDYCGSQLACEKQTALFMQVHAAFEQRDPSKLTALFGGMQAATIAMVQQMLQQVLADGVTLQNPAWYNDKDGGFHLAQYRDAISGEMVQIQEIKAHPLLKPLAEFLSRNNMTMADLGMTPKIHEEKEVELGKLAGGGNQQAAIGEFITKQADALQQLANKMNRATEQRENDPILLEYNRQNGGNDAG